MTFSVADRVKETTTTTGTGTLSLGGAVTQFQSFVSGIGSGNQCYYTILSGNGTDWECGIGTVTSGSPNTLSRSTILASSNSGSAISLTGTSTAFCSDTADVLRMLGANFLPAKTALLPFTTWLNQGSATLTNNTVGTTLFAPTSGASHDALMYYVSAPSTPYSYTIHSRITPAGFVANAGNTFCTAGLGWYDGTAKLEVLVWSYNGSAGPTFYVQDYTSFNGTVTNPFSGTGNLALMNDLWMQIRDDGTTVYYKVSYDGVNFFTVYSVAKASGFLGASGYKNPGLFADPYDLSIYHTIVSFSQGT